MWEFVTSIPGVLSWVGILILIIGFRSFGFQRLDLKEKMGIKTVMPVVVTLVVLAAAMYVILSKNYPVDTQKWAFSIVGLVVGYWLPST